MRPSVLLITAGFGAVVAGAIFLLGWRVLDLAAGTALTVGLALGAAQALGGALYVWRRFRQAGAPPRDRGAAH